MQSVTGSFFILDLYSIISFGEFPPVCFGLICQGWKGNGFTHFLRINTQRSGHDKRTHVWAGGFQNTTGEIIFRGMCKKSVKSQKHWTPSFLSSNLAVLRLKCWSVPNRYYLYVCTAMKRWSAVAGPEKLSGMRSASGGQLAATVCCSMVR